MSAAQMKVCPRCKSRAYLEQQTCVECGHQFRTQFVPPPDERTTLAMGEPPAPAPYPVHPVQPGQRTDLCAVLSCGCGALGMMLYPLFFGPPALLLGAVSLWRIRENPQLKGKFQAVVGTVLGLVCTVVAADRLNTSLSRPQPAVITAEYAQTPPAPAFTTEDRQRIYESVDRNLKRLESAPPPAPFPNSQRL